MAALQHISSERPLKILIVEDNPEDREAYQRILKRSFADIEILEAESVRQGLALSATNDPDCILLDYQLPDGNGIDFIRIYLDTTSPRAAIIMVTGQGSEMTAAEVMKLGALDYITKSSIMEGYFVQNVMNAIERAHLKEMVEKYQQELALSNKSLSEFTHTVSHDLKAPLRHISSYCELLNQECADKLGPDGRKYVSRLIVNTARLQRLIDDLLAYSLTLHAEAKMAHVDCAKILSEITEDLEEVIRENQAVITVQKLPTIWACPLRIKQVFQNLIDNSIKYRSDHPPLITITCEDRGSDYLFSVRDNGCGIEEEYRQTIFEAFKRQHMQDEVEGSGLGLSICRKVVDMHSGRIWVEQNPDGGSLFRFTIPKQAQT